jgi:protein O-mannosyl-transferase
MAKKKENKLPPLESKPRTRSPYFAPLSIAFLCLVTLFLYYPTLNYPFHYDDYHNIVENPHIKNIEDIPLFLEGLKDYSRWFRALPSLTLALNYHLHRLEVFGYHLINLLLHLASGILVYFISRHLLDLAIDRREKDTAAGTLSRNRVPLLSLFAALVFIVHPVQINTVTYIVQRNEGMCAFFFLLSFFLFIKGTKATGPFRFFYYAGVIITTIGAIFSKEVGFTLPVIIVLYDLVFVCKNRADILKRLRIYGLPILLIVLYVLFLLHGGVLRLLMKGHETWFWSPFENLLTQANVIIQYIKLLFIPWPGWMNIDHDFRVSRSLFEFPTILSVLAILCLFFIAIFLIRRRRVISFSIFWFFIILAPTSSLIPIWDIMVEYRLYLPMVAYGLILALGIDYLYRLLLQNVYHRLSQAVAIGVMVLFVSVYAFFAVQRQQVFRDSITLWEDAVRKSPNKTRTYINLGVMLHKSHRLEEARRIMEQTLGKRPKDNPLVHYNLGVVYSDLGRYEKAIIHLGEYLKVNPKDAQANNEMGAVYLRKGLLEESGSYFKRALEIRSTFAPAHAGLGDVFLKEGMIDEAISEYKKAIHLDPDLAKVHLRLAEAYLRKGMVKEARFEMKQAMTLSPEPDTYAGLGVIYLHENRLDQAIDFFRKALASSPNDPEVYNNLGVSYRKKEMIDEAIAQYRKAIELNPDFFDAHVNLGEAYRVKKMAEEALSEYKRAVTLLPHRPEPFNHLGALFLEKKRFDEAISHFNKAIAINPSYGEAHFNLAVAYYHKKDFQKAWEYCQKALTLGYEVNPKLIELLRTHLMRNSKS